MDIEPEKFKELRPKARQDIDNKLKNLELETGISIPGGLRQKFDDEFNQRYPANQEELYEQISDASEFISIITDFLRENGEELEPKCKDFIDKLVFQLYKETNGKGIGNDFWTHINNIWHLQNFAADLEKIELQKFSPEFGLNQILPAYVQLYELKIQIITDISRKIADKRRKFDNDSNKFVKTCRKKRCKE